MGDPSFALHEKMTRLQKATPDSLLKQVVIKREREPENVEVGKSGVLPPRIQSSWSWHQGSEGHFSLWSRTHLLSGCPPCSQ